MKKNINEELKDIKYLFNYNRGKILSEQEEFETEDDYDMETEDDYDMEIDEDIDFEVPTMMPGTKEKERIKIDPGTKPKQPKTPYRPKPGPKPDPKAGKEGDMPDWLSFDELGIDFE